MSDLRTLLHEAAGPMPTQTLPTVADADLSRGHRALRRRRAGRLGASSGLLAVTALGALAIAVPSVLPGTTTTTPVASAHAPAVAPLALVAYTGTQPHGYVLDKVPAGWTIADDDTGVLTLAPAGAKDAKDHSFVNKIAITAEEDTGVPDVPLDEVQVGDQPAVIAHMEGGDDTRTLFLKEPSGAYLNIQVWGGLGWNNDQIAEFAASVHMTEDAALSHG